MTRRPAVTLIEVLISMFIMAIGMLALLVLFPLGAVSMGKALTDDRCASTVTMADNLAVATNVRHDPNVITLGFNVPGASAVYVDPYGAIGGLLPVGTNPFAIPTAIIPRVAPSFISTSTVPVASTDRLFCLPDDIAFFENGTPDVLTSGGPVQRGLRYSYAYLLTRPQPLQDSLVQLTVAVYAGRPTSAPSQEPTYNAVGTAGTSGVTVSWTPPLQTQPNIKFGSWILDTTFGNTPNFYRVVNITEGLPNTLVLEVQPNLKLNIGTAVTTGAITVMENVAEVFDKGTGWQP